MFPVASEFTMNGSPVSWNQTNHQKSVGGTGPGSEGVINDQGRLRLLPSPERLSLCVGSAGQLRWKH